MKVKLKLHAIVSVILLFASFFLTGLFSFIQADFDVNVLLSGQFWFSTLTVVIINVIALASSITMGIPKFKENNEKLSDRENTISEFAQTEDPNLFEEFLIEFNLERKRKMYLNVLDNKINKLKNTMTLEERKLYFKGKEEEWNKKISKIKQLESERTEDYIAQNLEFANIDFPMVYSGSILSTGKLAMNNGLIDKHSGRDKYRWWLHKVLPGYVLSISLTAFWASFLITAVLEFSIILIIDVMVRILGILMNYVNGTYLSKEFVDEIALGDLDFSISVIKRFYLWKKNRQDAQLNIV
jgi:hypothetical protein